VRPDEPDRPRARRDHGRWRDVRTPDQGALVTDRLVARASLGGGRNATAAQRECGTPRDQRSSPCLRTKRSRKERDTWSRTSSSNA
jgi:hypothetical protein